MRFSRSAFLATAVLAASPPLARAQPAPSLGDYVRVLTERRLLTAEGGSIEALRATLRRAETLLTEGRPYDASLLLFEIVENPRFADFQDLDEFRGAEYQLATALLAQGAAVSARRYLERILARGPSGLYFRAAIRRMVDIALSTGNLGGIRQAISPLESGDLAEDPRNEIRYLDGKIRFESGDLAGADTALQGLTKRSRFFGPALYLRGLIAVRSRNYPRAGEAFCQVARPAGETFAFFVDDRYFQIQDLARLALGRVAHEQRRTEDAFYYYFQVPEDSDRLQEALFEGAWGMYEGGKADVALDFLEEMDRSFPGSPFRGEALILRAYVALDRCNHRLAERTIEQFLRMYRPVEETIDQILASPARQRALFDELLARAARSGATRQTAGNDPYSLILTHLRVDPDFLRMHGEVRLLDLEAGRAGRIGADFALLRRRVVEGERILSAPAPLEDDTVALDAEVAETRRLLGGLEASTDRLARDRAPAAEIAAARAELRALGQRLENFEDRLERARTAAGATGPTAAGPGGSLEDLLGADAARGAALPGRIASLRRRLVTAANAVALEGLERLRESMRTLMRRAEMGRIDASLGITRQLERRIEMLASGELPPEALTRAQEVRYIGDDEEYWPYEGEYWDDEYE